MGSRWLLFSEPRLRRRESILQGLPSDAFFSMERPLHRTGERHTELARLLLRVPHTKPLQEQAMVKRVSKIRKSAILEHLLDLERQIRAELAKSGPEQQTPASSERRRPRDETMSRDGDAMVATDIAQRYLH